MLNNTQRSSTDLLSKVHEGMTVYDSNSKSIGTVSDLYFGAAADEQQAYGSGPATAPARGDMGNGEDALIANNNESVPVLPLIPTLGVTNGGGPIGAAIPAFDFEDNVPAAERSRLLAEGFVQIKGAGLLGTARYVTPNQIASVDNDALHLNVTADELTRLA